MIKQSSQTTLEMRLSLYLRDISDKDKQFRLNLIEYWLSDSDFSDIEPEQDIAYSFSAIFRVIEGENNPENKTKVFKEWFSLLGLYFLNIGNNPHFSESRRLDFASFCLFIVENFVGGDETVRKTGQIAHQKSLSKKGNDRRHGPLRPLIDRAIVEYPKAARVLKSAGAKITYDSIAEAVWPKIEPFNRDTAGNEIIDSKDAPEVRIKAWFKTAVKNKLILSTTVLKQKK